MKKASWIKTLFLLLLIVWTFTVFNFGFYQGRQQVPEPPKELPEGVDLTLLWDVWNVLEQKYAGEIDYQKMIYGAASGMVKSLGDPYTVFFKPDDSKIFKEDIAGSFEGVGMEVTMKNGELIVVTPLEGTPAQKAGLLPGDKIIKVGDVSVKGLTVEEAVKLIRGEKGTVVTLSVTRKGWDEPRKFDITRGVIKIPSMSWKLMEGDIAKINIYQFSGTLSMDFAKAANEILKSPAKKIVLDLRNNPGGLLDEAQSIAGWFVEKGDIVTIEKFGGDKESKKYLAKGNELFLQYPIVVLMNKGTASGAEILAAALRDNRSNVKLIGEQSFGKGSVQEPVDLEKGALLKVTVAHWLTPNGQLIDKQGLTPDIKVEMTEKDYQEGKDPQLQKAIEVLKEM